MGNLTPPSTHPLQVDHSQQAYDDLLKKIEEAKKNKTGPYDPINIAIHDYTDSLDPNTAIDHDHYIDNVTNIFLEEAWWKELNCQPGESYAYCFLMGHEYARLLYPILAAAPVVLFPVNLDTPLILNVSAACIGSFAASTFSGKEDYFKLDPDLERALIASMISGGVVFLGSENELIDILTVAGLTGISTYAVDQIIGKAWSHPYSISLLSYLSDKISGTNKYQDTYWSWDNLIPGGVAPWEWAGGFALALYIMSQTGILKTLPVKI